MHLASSVVDAHRLPVSGPLRLLIIAASISLLAFLASLILLIVRKEKQAAGWAAGLVVVSLISFVLGRSGSALHPIASLVIGLLAIRNVLRFEGTARVLQVAGLVTWLIAVIAARALFAA